MTQVKLHLTYWGDAFLLLYLFLIMILLSHLHLHHMNYELVKHDICHCLALDHENQMIYTHTLEFIRFRSKASDTTLEWLKNKNGSEVDRYE